MNVAFLWRLRGCGFSLCGWWCERYMLTSHFCAIVHCSRGVFAPMMHALSRWMYNFINDWIVVKFGKAHHNRVYIVCLQPISISQFTISSYVRCGWVSVLFTSVTTVGVTYNLETSRAQHKYEFIHQISSTIFCDLHITARSMNYIVRISCGAYGRSIIDRGMCRTMSCAVWICCNLNKPRARPIIARCIDNRMQIYRRRPTHTTTVQRKIVSCARRWMVTLGLLEFTFTPIHPKAFVLCVNIHIILADIFSIYMPKRRQNQTTHVCVALRQYVGFTLLFNMRCDVMCTLGPILRCNK